MIKLNNDTYELIEDFHEGYQEEAVKEKFTDFFEDYEYVVGDWAYGKLRLKGFNTKKSKNYKSINDVDSIDEYIRDYCAYGCKYFILKKNKVE